MRMLILPAILTLSACAALAPPEPTAGKTYFNYPRQCDGCDKNETDRLSALGRLAPQAEPLSVRIA